MRKQKLRHAMLWSGIFACTIASASEPSPSMLAGPCMACHGPNGVSAGPATPTIAGMSENYFITAMLAYKFDNDTDKIDEAIDADEEGMEFVENFPRNSTIMNRLAKGYTIDQIKSMAKFFAGLDYAGHKQEHDAAKAKKGAKFHKAHCEKCHEDVGRVVDDDAGLLAGQWMTYLEYALADFHDGNREMPKKMSKQMKEMIDRNGEESLADLVHFYGSQK